MNTSALENQPAAAEGRDGKRGHGAGIAAGVAVFVLGVLLVLPGFMAAGFSRMKDGHAFCETFWGASWDGDNFTSKMPPGYNVELAILRPSGWVMGYSKTVRRFYTWEYRKVGGNESGVRVYEW